jgi:radical SAM family uncharacterized protein
MQLKQQNNFLEEKINSILPLVQKPGRYTGGELNSIVKDWKTVKSRVALVFPDIYDLGLPNLGLAILYDLLNKRQDVLAERCYTPWVDMEDLMRKNEIPLFSLETKHPLIDFDIIGFSLPYETLYSNVLNMLDLAGIPVHSNERTLEHPLVIAGGHAAFNPEPMHAFIDAFVMGEGEEVMGEIVDFQQKWKLSGLDRQSLLSQLALIRGVYVPSLYSVSYFPDGRVQEITPVNGDIPFPITKRIMAKLPPPVTRFIVPYIEIVHDRVAIEIMRGCTRGCRFCHAGMITRPVRERPVNEIMNAIDAALEATGHEEVALLSLSSSDYSHIQDLVDALSEKYTGNHLVVSLPSLRIESFSVDIMDKLKGTRLGGFTLAPEAATDRMRQIINKPVSTENLLETARAIYSRGWTTIKLYFMIGHPSETMEDVRAIIDLCKQVYQIGRSVVGGRAKVHAGIGTFVPKAHTPFQWTACDDPDSVHDKQNLLRTELRNPNIKVSWTDPKDTQMEAWLARGDRRLSDVIFTAWESGARFDAWQDQNHYEKWLTAFKQNGLDPAFYSHRERHIDEVMPWSHINTGVRDTYLLAEYKSSKEGNLRKDCRDECFACGIMPEFTAEFLPDWNCPPPKTIKKAREELTV